jgi:uncharacterized ion transporter superfamily protein YfcC
LYIFVVLKNKHDIMEPEKIQEFITNARQNGYSDSEIQKYLNDKDSTQDYSGYFVEKKKIHTLFAIHFGSGLYGVAFHGWFFGLHAR